MAITFVAGCFSVSSLGQTPLEQQYSGCLKELCAEHDKKYPRKRSEVSALANKLAQTTLTLKFWPQSLVWKKMLQDRLLFIENEIAKQNKTQTKQNDDPTANFEINFNLSFTLMKIDCEVQACPEEVVELVSVFEPIAIGDDVLRETRDFDLLPLKDKQKRYQKTIEEIRKEFPEGFQVFKESWQPWVDPKLIEEYDGDQLKKYSEL
jgi:hypothetical protein